MNQIRVVRDKKPDSAKPWIVVCGHCAGHDLDMFSAFLAFVAGPKWWAPNWRLAQDFATQHAAAHEATRCPHCPHCLHLPARQLAPEETRR